MAELLNAIIRRGGTTAMTRPVTAEGLADHLGVPGAIWHLAEDDDGTLLGFQWIEPVGNPADGACDIASFVRIGETGRGVASRLFEATRDAARTAGFAWISAEIRADNEGGLTYYQSRGFERYGRIAGKRLEDGTIVDKVLMRYDL